MKTIIFNGSIDKRQNYTGKIISKFIIDILDRNHIETDVFNVGHSDIPLLDPQQMANPPQAVTEMCEAFQKADRHFWLAPLYHGSIPGLMKNCLDWLEVTSQ